MIEVQPPEIGQVPSSRNMRAASGSAASERATEVVSSAENQSTSRPSFASFTAGASRSATAGGRIRACASPMPETTPGTATAVAPCDVAVVQHRGPGEEILGDGAAAGERIVGRIERHRRAHAVVDHAGAAFAGAPQHHGAAGGRPAHPGLDHADGEGDRDGGVHRVAAGIEHGRADFGRAAVRRGDHAAAGGDHRFADDLGAGKVIHGKS